MIEKLIGIYKKHKEGILYLFFGGCTTLINWGVSVIMYYIFKQETVFSNIVSNFLAVTFAYVTNKLFVFESRGLKGLDLLKEIAEFYLIRAIFIVLDVVAMSVCVDKWGFEFAICKVAVSAIVIVANYICSKLIIFKKKKEDVNVENEENNG